MSTPFRRAAGRSLALAAGIVAGLVLVDRLLPFDLPGLARPTSVLVEDASGQPLRIFLAADDRYRLPVHLDEVPPELVRALVTAEDARFWGHPGVDLLAVVRAALSNLRAGRVVSGASTLTMQVARLARPAPRTWRAKLGEALAAVRLELRYSKREILALYLNLAPFGGNLEGVGAACWFYFGKPPAQLSLGEIALLVALPRSPTRLDPARDPEASRAARDTVLARLAAAGAFGRAEVVAAQAQPVPAGRRPLPLRAPHFALLARERGGRGPRLTTTLEPRIQAAAESAVRGRIAELRAAGVGNAAAVVLDLAERRVLALVGSAGFDEDDFAGQVNGAVARRSPGSTLKPFLYAQAYDQGLIVPQSYLLDIPTDFAGYVAENYDGVYHGRVTAEEALVTSLNAPAVRLLSQLGVPPFLDLLHRGGLATLDRPVASYGLPLVLGGGEVTLLDLTNLYASLAAGGAYRPLRLLAKGPEPAVAGSDAPAVALFSPPAARLVVKSLGELARPDLPTSWDLARGVATVAWKTGTSYGHRDAWAVGFSGRYAIGVWVGNFSGRPVKGIAGSQHAGPLLFDLFRVLGDDSRPELLAAGGDDLLQVCATSHLLPGAYCQTRTAVAYLPGRTRLGTCQAHQRVFVDRATGELLAGPCLARRPFEARVLTLRSRSWWPSAAPRGWR